MVQAAVVGEVQAAVVGEVQADVVGEVQAALVGGVHAGDGLQADCRKMTFKGVWYLWMIICLRVLREVFHWGCIGRGY